MANYMYASTLSEHVVLLTDIYFSLSYMYVDIIMFTIEVYALSSGYCNKSHYTVLPMRLQLMCHSSMCIDEWPFPTASILPPPPLSLPCKKVQELSHTYA